MFLPDYGQNDEMCIRDSLKIGSAASFLKKEHGVECIHGYSLPVGVSGQLSLDPFRIRMYDGNLLFMVTDGVLGALPVGEEEQILKDLIGNLPAGTPAEMAERLLEQVEAYGAVSYTHLDVYKRQGIFRKRAEA